MWKSDEIERKRQKHVATWEEFLARTNDKYDNFGTAPATITLPVHRLQITENIGLTRQKQ